MGEELIRLRKSRLASGRKESDSRHRESEMRLEKARRELSKLWVSGCGSSRRNLDNKDSSEEYSVP